jgi:chromosome segregation ATPase
MSEKKKRFRPTVTAYRELERLVTELRSRLESSRQYCDELKEKVSSLESRNRVLEQSNGLVSGEIDRLRNVNNAVGNRCSALRKEIYELKNRSLWDRIFNR